MAVSAKVHGRVVRRPALLLAIVVAVAFAAGLVAIWSVPPLLDWDRYRDQLMGLASAGLGRPVSMDGPISLRLLPQPTLSAAEVVIPDTGDGASATVREMRLQIGLGALLGGRLEVTDLVLHGAAARLPWPPGVTQWGTDALQRRPPAWLTRLHATVEDGSLQVGGLSVTGIDGDVAVDPQTGTLSARGLAELLGRSWRISGRLGQVGGDGSATLDISLDGEGEAKDTGGTLSGQIAADGSLEGQIKGRGPNLGLLLAAPAVAWRASGRIAAGAGLAVASDLDLDIGGAPALGAVALRVLPSPRVDAALSAGRLDLDAWLPVLLRGGGTALATGIDLSAEQASLAGGTLRRLRAGFEVAPDGVLVRDAEAVLPGGASLHLDGRVSAGRFHGDGRLDAADLRETRRWLRPLAPAFIDALPTDALRSADVTAQVDAGGGSAQLAGIAGRIDGAAVSGDMSVRRGEHPAVTATLAATELRLDAWLPTALPADLRSVSVAMAEMPRRWAGFDLDLTVNAMRPTWRGTALDTATLVTKVSPDGWRVKRAEVKAPWLDVAASFGLAEGGVLRDGQLRASVPHAEILAKLWPALPPAVLVGPATLNATASGWPSGLRLNLGVDIADMRLEAVGKADLAARQWSGSVSARHPGASRLLGTLGLPDTAGWLGAGSMSLQAEAEITPGVVSLRDADVTAGSLRATVSGSLDRRGPFAVLQGQIAGETLPLPLPVMGSPEPLPFGALQGWQGQLAVKAAHVLLGQSPVLEDASAEASVRDGGLRLTGLAGTVAGGRLTGSLTAEPADAGSSPIVPPRLQLQAAVNNAAITGPLLDTVPDLASGRIDGTARLQATGYSPATLLATLSGEASATVQDGALMGVDLDAALAALRQADAEATRAGASAALNGGTTPFSRLELAAVADGGVVTLRRATLTAAAGAIESAGTIDLPGASEDMVLSVQPTAGPRLDVRLIGPASHPQRAAGLADLTRYLGEQHPLTAAPSAAPNSAPGP